MPPRKQSKRCQVCEEVESKYKCAAKRCGVLYCSVPCYKKHKESCISTNSATATNPLATSEPAETIPPPEEPEAQPEAGPSQPLIDAADDLPPLYPSHKRRREKTPEPLRALTTLSWPPEADPKVYTDPLTRDDPKPLRRSEIMAIGESYADVDLMKATSPVLRRNLAAPSHDPTLPTLPNILEAIDALDPSQRSRTLSRILGLDLSNHTEAIKVGDVWIGERERMLVREFAETVRQTLETEERGNKAEWEI